MPQIIRWSSWLVLTAIFILSVVPASARPVVGPHGWEHGFAFALAGAAFMAGHRFAFLSAAGVLSFYAILIEILQLLVPGRHARLSDIMIDAGAAVLGAGLVHFSKWLKWKDRCSSVDWGRVPPMEEPPALDSGNDAAFECKLSICHVGSHWRPSWSPGTAIGCHSGEPPIIRDGGAGAELPP
jgi:hypothetical protein